MEHMLVEWMLAEDKCLFEKREVDQKVKEIWGNKRPMALKKTLHMLSKYPALKNVILVAKNGEKHYMVEEFS